MSLKHFAIALALLAIGFGAGAYVGYRFFIAELRAAFAPVATEAAPTAVAARSALPPPSGPTESAAQRAMPAFEPAPVAPSLPDPKATLDSQRAAALAYRAFVADEVRRMQEQGSWVMRRLYENEGHDPAWAAAITPRIEQKLRDEKPFGNAVVESIECRVTVCKLVVFNAREQFLQEARLNPGTIPAFLSWKTEFDLDQGLNPDHTGFRATVWLGDDFEEGHLRRVKGLVTSTTVEQGRKP